MTWNRVDMLARLDAHRAQLPDHEGMRVFCCDGCLVAGEIPTLVAENVRLTRELDEQIAAHARTVDNVMVEGWQQVVDAMEAVPRRTGKDGAS